ncbi:3-dehydroquinate synthase [Flavobacteriaceae bacterium MAR_2010_188]|nr:3-dehydroquinate synthase [Flavobacteriaceae bacterium MAR_2010_188]
MKSIVSSGCEVHFDKLCYEALNEFISVKNPSKIIVLVDTNTQEYCLKLFLSQLKTNIHFEVLSIEAGEEYKTIDTCLKLWNELSNLGTDRESLIINLGGGVITDLGGFVACTFKRGIRYINVPTSLLAMVDASVGGKTGVDLGNLKNQIGVIDSGEMVLVDIDYLKTLPENQLKSGYSEMLKHGLIYDRDYWDRLKNHKDLSDINLSNEIHRSVEIKNEIVKEDPYEKGLRKTLNFGHTLGHAVESYFLSLEDGTPLLHGEAIGIGMILESYISSELLNFPKDDLAQITQVFNCLFNNIHIEIDQQQAIIELMKFDKKNSHGNINFVLLEEIGKPKIDCIVKNSVILEAFEYYNKSL